MYKEINYIDGLVVVQSASDCSKATKGFTNSAWLIDTSARTLKIKDYAPLPLPLDVNFVPGKALEFALAGSDGKLRKQRRTVLLPDSVDEPFKVKGHMMSPEAKEAGKGMTVKPFKFRAYITHDGVATDVGEKGTLPRFILEHIIRAGLYWRRLAILCIEARTGKETVDAQYLISHVIRPAYDAFNNSLDREHSKSKLRYPTILKVKYPSLGGLLGIAFNLEKLEAAGRPAPEGLAAAIHEYVGSYVPDYTALNAFQNAKNFNDIAIAEQIVSYPSLLSFQRTLHKKGIHTAARYAAERAVGHLLHLPEHPESVYRVQIEEVFEPIQTIDLTVDLNEEQIRRVTPTGLDAIPMTLRWWEIAPLKKAFMSVLKARRTRKLAFFKGWPHPSGSDDSWGVSYYLNGAKDTVSDLCDPTKGIGGLRLGPEVDPVAGGSHRTKGSHRDRQTHLHPAEICFRDVLSGENCSFRFAVVLHQKMPPEAQIKGWQLSFKDNEYHLIITVAVPKPLTLMPTAVAAINLGWRSTPQGIKVATMFTPGADFQEAFVDLLSPQPGTEKRDKNGAKVYGPDGKPMTWVRQPFHAYMGQTRRALRDKKNGYDLPPDIFESTERLQKSRDDHKDALKAKLQVALSDPPAWIGSAGGLGLRRLLKNMTTDPQEFTPEDLQFIPEIREWLKKDELIGEQFRALWTKLSGRLKNEYQLVAHQVCKYLLDHRVTVLALPTIGDFPEEADAAHKKTKTKRHEEKGMLQQLAVKPNNFADEAMKASTNNRQRAGVSIFVQWLTHIAKQQGLTVVTTDAKYTTQTHYGCGEVSKHIGSDLLVLCKCGVIYDQDRNAALNLAAIATADLGLDKVKVDGVVLAA